MKKIKKNYNNCEQFKIFLHISGQALIDDVSNYCQDGTNTDDTGQCAQIGENGTSKSGKCC